MAIWPFRRKARGGSSRVNATRRSIDRVHAERLVENPGGRGTTTITAHDATALDRQNSGRRTRRRRRANASSKEVDVGEASRDAGTAGPSASKRRSPVTLRKGSQSAPDLPRTRGDMPRRDANDDTIMEGQDDIPSYYFLNPMSSTSLASDRRGSWQRRPPTLHAKRGANDPIVRRRSSKKKKHDHVREQEIKMMSTSERPLKRPATQSAGARGGSGVAKGDVGPEGLSTSPAKRRERPTSDIFVPDPQAMAGISNRPEYKVRSLDMLAPRPTIKYAKTMSTTDLTEPWTPSRSNSRRGKQTPITEQVINERKRVEDLADDMDASELRQLMERDQRRRERKRKADEGKLQRRLERRAEKQRKAEERAGEWVAAGMEAGHPSPKPELSRLDIDESPAEPPGGPVRQSPRLAATDSPLSWLQDPSVERLHTEVRAEDGKRTSREAEAEKTSPVDDQEEPVIGTAQAVRLSQASMSPPGSLKQIVRPTSNISHVTDNFRDRTGSASDRGESDARASSSARGSHATTWMSFFRRSANKVSRDSNERGRKTPSEFSNTSRDSLSRQQPPPASVRSSFQRRSGTPVRTTSKFREELPEMPISPPDSRLQSPDPARKLEQPGQVAAPARPEQLPKLERPAMSPAATPASPTSPTSPTSLRSAQQTSATGKGKDDASPNRPRHRSMEAPSIEGKAVSAAVSQSMASIDSEGSWLSGKPAKRSSQTQGFALRHSTSSLRPSAAESSGSESDVEESAVAEDEYFSRLTPGVEYEEAPPRMRKPSSTAIASSESEGERERDRDHGRAHSGVVVSRHPTVVHHTTRPRSREGLLNDYNDGVADPAAHPVAPTVDTTSHLRSGNVAAAGGSPTGGSPAIDDASPSEAIQSFETPLETPTDDASPKDDASPTDIDLGTRQHVRHISAGSARLLEIAPRGSHEHRGSVVSTHSGATAT